MPVGKEVAKLGLEAASLDGCGAGIVRAFVVRRWEGVVAAVGGGAVRAEDGKDWGDASSASRGGELWGAG